MVGLTTSLRLMLITQGYQHCPLEQWQVEQQQRWQKPIALGRDVAAWRVNRYRNHALLVLLLFSRQQKIPLVSGLPHEL